MKKYIKYIVIAIILIALIFGYMSCRKKKNRPEWRTDTTSFGNIREVVTATGSLNPYVLVEVGTEVSGKIEKLYKDFNDNVKRGELLATLDTELLRTALESSRAELTKAQTSQAEAKLDHDNLVELVKHGMAAEYELRKAEFRMQQAQQSLATARLNLQRAQKNLDNAYIKSPIDGVIVGRSVDEGQTVAASLNAPTLFKIANNLDKMQITANVDEADIGRIKVGLPVEFSVDAYTTMAFTGEVQQIRLNPVTEQNVVSYSVIIDADNPGRVLLPGMTTNVTIIVKSRENAMRIPETATRFRASNELWSLFGLKWDDESMQKEREKAMEELQKEIASALEAQSENTPDNGEAKAEQGESAPRTGRGGGQGRQGGQGVMQASGGGMPSGGRGMMGMGGAGMMGMGGRGTSMASVWILKNDKPELRMVQTGISDGAFVEVISGIKEGETLISGVVYKNSKQASQSSPMGGPGMRRF